MLYLFSVLFLLYSTSSNPTVDVHYEKSTCQPADNDCNYIKKYLQTDWTPLEGGLPPWYEQNDGGAYVTSNPRNDKINPSNRTLRIFYPKGKIGSSSGNSWKVGINPQKEYWSMFSLYFPDGKEKEKKNNDCFNFQCGGKLPGFCGGPCADPSQCTKDEWEHQGCNTGGAQIKSCSNPDPKDGWSARVMFRQFGIAVSYLYSAGAIADDGYGYDIIWQHPDSQSKCMQSTHEQHITTLNTTALVTFVRGKWQQVIQRVVMNTVSQDGPHNDGSLSLWLDGHQVLSCTNLTYRCLNTVSTNKFYFSTFFGGSSSKFAPPTDQHAYFDDFIISEESLENKLVDMSLEDWNSRHSWASLKKCPIPRSIACNLTASFY